MASGDFLTTPGIAPPWLLGKIGALKLRMLGSTIDQLTGETSGKSTLSATAANAMRCDATALPLVGGDRLLTQGPSEPAATFRLRCRSAIDTWRQFAGNDWGILVQAIAQVTGLNGATPPRARVVSNSGSWSWFEAGADTTQPPWIGSGAWNWDGQAPHGPDVAPGLESSAWWRCWLLLESIGGGAFAAIWAPLGTGGQPVLGTSVGSSLGFVNVPPSFWTQLRAVLETFRAKHSPVRWILVEFSATHLLDPTGAFGPDGTWGYGYVITSGQYQRAWTIAVTQVPGAIGPQPSGAPNHVVNQTFGYRIVGGQYQPY